MKQNVEIVSLIYRSTAYADFIIDQLLNEANNLVPGWSVGVRLVGNNPTAAVAEHVRARKFPYSEYQDPKPNDFYLDRTYRAWNWAVATSDFDNVCLVNSDMGFSPGWLSNLLKHHDGTNIPCSRLIESGRLASAEPHTISVNFGRHPREYQESEFLKYADSVRRDHVEPHGTYMPCVFEKQRFLEAGGYPEGNLYTAGGQLQVGWRDNPGRPPDSKSGDYHFLREVLSEKFGMRQITVFDSVVWHFQEGEKSE